jgi:hypothetical protein
MKSFGLSRRSAALLAGVALAACEGQPVAPQTADPLAGMGPGIHPVLVVAPAEGGAQVDLHLRRVQVEVSVASYQGELRYDAGAMRLSSAQLPAGVVGAWNEVQPGRVRFAGVAPSGVGDGAVLTLRFAAASQPARESFGLVMEELIAPDFAELTDRVSSPLHPVLSTAPLEQ